MTVACPAALGPRLAEAQTEGMAVACAVAKRKAFSRALTNSISMTGTGTDRVAVTGTANRIAVARTITDRRTDPGTRTHGVGRTDAGNQQMGFSTMERNGPELRIPAGARGKGDKRTVAIDLNFDDREAADRGGRDQRRRRRTILAGAKILTARITATNDAVEPGSLLRNA